MDKLDPIRELVVRAMAELEEAMEDAVMAQNPHASAEQIGSGLVALKGRLADAQRLTGDALRQLYKVR